jgi:isopentenyl phosphate kinase
MEQKSDQNFNAGVKRKTNLIFLKLGGSLITDKQRPRTPRVDVIKRLAGEVAHAYQTEPTLKLVLGHGSGSFGHVPAKTYQTREGVSSRAGWLGFVEVWRDASALNRIMIDALKGEGVPAVSFPPSACVSSRARKISAWNLTPIRRAIESALLPVVFGDVVFDEEIGGTIFSTEELFSYLAPVFTPDRILFAGLEPGVWEDYPLNSKLIRKITPANFSTHQRDVGASNATDVTGGMYSKVQDSLSMIQSMPGLEILIFSGEEPGSITRALSGENLGTLICSA